MTTKQTSGSAAISSSLWPRTSVTKKIAPASRSGRASTGRARKPPANCVVSMPTLFFSTMSQTRSMSSRLGHDALSVTEGERRAARAGSGSRLLANARKRSYMSRADRNWSDPSGLGCR